MICKTSEHRLLLLQRLGEVARARLHLVEQARVLDGDDRLVREGVEQRDLSVGEQAKLQRGGAR